MARGRFINKTVATDKKVAVLTEVYGPFATVFHHRIIAFLDVNGNVRADEFWLKATLFPIDDGVSPEDCRKFSVSLAAVGLAVSYHVDGINYLHFQNFDKNQHGLRKDKERAEYPEYNQEVGKVTEKVGKSSDQSAYISLSPSLSQSSSPSQPPPSESPQAQTGAERFDGSGGGSVVLDPEGGGEEGLESLAEGGAGEPRAFGTWPDYPNHEPDQTTAPRNGYANQSDYHRDFVKEKLAGYAAERKAENERIDRETAAGVGKWTAEFASLIKNCDLETRDEIRTAIANLKSQDQLQDTLDKAKAFIESGQSKSPKGLILHRIKQLA